MFLDSRFKVFVKRNMPRRFPIPPFWDIAANKVLYVLPLLIEPVQEDTEARDDLKGLLRCDRFVPEPQSGPAILHIAFELAHIFERRLQGFSDRFKTLKQGRKTSVGACVPLISWLVVAKRGPFLPSRSGRVGIRMRWFEYLIDFECLENPFDYFVFLAFKLFWPPRRYVFRFKTIEQSALRVGQVSTCVQFSEPANNRLGCLVRRGFLLGFSHIRADQKVS